MLGLCRRREAAGQHYFEMTRLVQRSKEAEYRLERRSEVEQGIGLSEEAKFPGSGIKPRLFFS